MNWYYVHEGNQEGPHSDETLQELARTGVIDSTTLVWREGMGDWQPISLAAPQLLPVSDSGLAPASDTAHGQCAECGVVLPVSEMISVLGAKVCARCHPLHLQKIRQRAVLNRQSVHLPHLLKIAEAQRALNLCLLISIASYALVVASGGSAEHAHPRNQPPDGPMVPGSFVGLVALLAVTVFQIIFVYRLASALGSDYPILWVLGINCLSCVGLIFLLILSGMATRQLRSAGIKVGLLGANPKEIQRLMSGS
jgi:hypothetical protein